MTRPRGTAHARKRQVRSKGQCAHCGRHVWVRADDTMTYHPVSTSDPKVTCEGTFEPAVDGSVVSHG